MGARVRTLYRWPGKRERSEAEDFFCTRTTVLHCAQVVGCVAKAAARVAGRNPAGGPAPGPLASRPHTCRAIKALIFAGSGAMVQEAPLVESI